MALKSLRTKVVFYSVALILVIAIPVITVVSVLVNKSVKNDYRRSVTLEMQTIDMALELFYEDLDNNIDMFAEHALLKLADNTITSYTTADGVMMTTEKNGGIEQKIYEAFDNYAQTHPGTLYVYMGTEDGGYIQ
ncbi:hypothetical protein [Desulfogranum japonicum]|uniref:hypothetical protein n=1 Tax=Desulfogranum japonicum TaxID=231447 RepID=UPI0004113425|nr:hypothetical protein [Desulfogranum japonicum]